MPFIGEKHTGFFWIIHICDVINEIIFREYYKFKFIHIMEMSPLTGGGTGDTVAYNKQENSIGTVSMANFNSSK